MEVSTSSAQSRRRRSTPSRMVKDMLASHQDSKDGRHTEVYLWFTIEPAHKAQHLALSLT